MRDLLNKLDTVSENNISEFRVDAGRPHDFYRHDNYYGNPRMWGMNPLTGMLFTAAEIAALSNRGVTPQMVQQMPPQQMAQVVQAAPTTNTPIMPSSTTTTTGPAVPVGQPIAGATKYYNPNGDGTFQDHPYTQSGDTAGSPVDTTKADTDNAAKIARFKELLVKAGVGDSSAEKTDYSLAGDKANNGLGMKIKEGFARDPLLEKLRLIDSGHKFNEGLTPEESKELDKLYGDLSVTGKNDPKLAPLFAQYNKVPSVSAADPATPNTAADPVDTTKPQQWAPGVLHVGMGMPPASPDPKVMELQKKLGITPADGRFGPGTEKAVKAKQTEIGAKPDGAWGPESQAKFAAKGGTAPSPSATPGAAGGASAIPADASKKEPYWVNGTRYEWNMSGGGRGQAATGKWKVTATPQDALQWNSTRYRSMNKFTGPDSAYGKTATPDATGTTATKPSATPGDDSWDDKNATKVPPMNLDKKPMSAQQRLAQQNVERAKAKAAQLAAAGQDSGTFKQGQLQPNESVEFSFADQLIESFGYQPK